MSSKLILPAAVIGAGAFFFSTLITSQAAPEGIPAGAEEFEGHWYLAVGAKRIHWQNALDKSIESGGYLACLETEAERAFVNALADKKSELGFWIGGYSTGDGWRWINGQPLDSRNVTKIGQTSTLARVRLTGSDPRNKRTWSSILPNADYNTAGYIVEWEPGVDVALTLPESTLPGATTPTSPTPGAPAMSTVVLEGNPHAKPIILKKAQVEIKGLLVIALGGDASAGGTSLMNLTSIAGDPEKPATVGFNQPVGQSMATALKEVLRFIELRHNGWPRGRTMEIAFADKYSPKDGPSAAVACALLLDSALTANDLDPHFAVTGDLNADGTVQPIGGVDGKIRGATKGGCALVALPESNKGDVFDTVLLHGFGPIAEIQVFSIATFDEALAAASVEKPSQFTTALTAFEEVQQVYRRDPAAFLNSLKHPKMIEKLREILSNAPNHLSATIMLAHAEGSAPSNLSLHGSVSFINGNAYQIVDVIDENGRVIEKSGIFDENQVTDALNQLKRTRPRLDERTWKWVDDLLAYGNILNEWQTNRPNSVTQQNKLVDAVNAAAKEVRSERQKLMSNPEVVEELAF